MFVIYGDESLDARGERVIALAALLGNEDQWAELNRPWAARTGGMPFHAADCESGYGDYRALSQGERAQLSLDLARILANSGIIGFGIGIDVAGCRRAFPDMLPDHNYYSAFLRTVDFLVERAGMLRGNEPVRIIFDRHKRTEHNCRLLHKYAFEEGQWAASGTMIDELSFASRDDVGIQAADLWVREFMKYFDGQLFSEQYATRPQCQALLDTKRFGGDFLCAEYFEDLKRKLPVLEAQTGMDRAKYLSWLQAKGRQDNQSNRILYITQIAAMDRHNRE